MSAPLASLGNISEKLRDIKVGVRAELEVSRHIFNGQPAYVVRDPITFQTHKLSPADYQVLVAIRSDEILGATFQRLCHQEILEKDQEEGFFPFHPAPDPTWVVESTG